MFTEKCMVVPANPTTGRRSGMWQSPSTEDGCERKICVLVVNKRPLVCNALAALIGLQEDFDPVETAINCAECCRKALICSPNVLVCDLETGDNRSAESLGLFRERFPTIPAIVLHEQLENWRVMGAVRLGAQGYLTPEAKPMELFKAIRLVVDGGTYFEPRVQALITASAAGGLRHHRATSPYALSDRELNVLKRVAEGDSNQRIAEVLCVSRSTVKHYVSTLLVKLEAANRTVAVRKAIDLGLLET
ncbi:MAG: response regulator transcription factor [Pseudomonadota bacterium]